MTLFRFKSKQDLDNLVATMLLDIGKYKVEKNEDGLRIKYPSKKQDVKELFTEIIKEWIMKETFIINGDKFFSNTKYNEKWNIWKQDERFINAYMTSSFIEFTKDSFEDESKPYFTSIIINKENVECLDYDLFCDLTFTQHKQYFTEILEHFISDSHIEFINLINALKTTKSDKIILI